MNRSNHLPTKLAIIFGSVSVLFLTGCGSSPSSDATAESGATVQSCKDAVTGKAKYDFFMEEQRVVGRVSANRETAINPLVSGTIKELDATTGSIVKAGQILAKIDLGNSSFQTTLENAQTAYQNAQTSYTITKQGVDKDLETAQIQLDNAKNARDNVYASTEKQLTSARISLQNMQTTFKNTDITTQQALNAGQISIQLAQQSYDNAKTNLDNFEQTSKKTLSGLATKKESAYENTRVALQNIFPIIDTVLTQTDTILGITDTRKNMNDSYEAFLGAQDLNTKLQAENAWRDLQKNYQSTLAKFRANEVDETVIRTELEDAITMLKLSDALMSRMVDMLNASVSSYSFQQSTISGFISNMKSLQSQILSTQSSFVQTRGTLNDLNETIASTTTTIETNRTSLNNAIQIAETQLANARQGYNNTSASRDSSLDSVAGNQTSLQVALESTIATIKSSRDSADNAVRIAEQSLASAKEGAKSKINSAKTGLDGAKGQVELAQIQYKNSLIVAPFDGVILSRTAEIGGLVSSQMPVFTIGDKSSLKIRVDIPSDLLDHLKVGQTVSIKKNDITYTGSIALLPTSISSTNLSGNGEITFVGKTDGLKIGDMVDVYIHVSYTKNKTILVPFSAIISTEKGKYSIFVVQSDNKIIRKLVILGAQNKEWTEILSGITQNDTLVLDGTSKLSDGDCIK